MVSVSCSRLVAQSSLGSAVGSERQAAQGRLRSSIRGVQCFLQAALTSAQLRHQEAHAVWGRAVAAGQQMQADLVQLRSSTEQALRECR